MNKQAIENLVLRLSLYAGAFALLLAFAEGFTQLLGSSLVSHLYAPSRMLEIGATLLILAIALLLKQIRDKDQ